MVEVFGGEPCVGKSCTRRRLVRGEDFDLVSGFDLIDMKQQEEVVRYFNTFKPFVALFVPPCTGSGQWSHLDRYIHPETLPKSRGIGEQFAQFVARLCEIQLKDNRHLIVENAGASELFRFA